MRNSPDRVRVLLDECLPKKLKRDLVNCVVFTVAEMGWAGKKNGELMSLARGQFDVFLTADQNLQYQQNMAYAEVGVVVLVAMNNRREMLVPLMPKVNAVLSMINPGQVLEIDAGTI